MRVLFDLTHPGHVHLFKHAIWELVDRNHVVGVTARDKEVTIDLLDAYDIHHSCISAKRSWWGSTVIEWLIRDFRMVHACREFDPDVIVSRVVPTAVHAARVCGAKSVVFGDTEFSGYLAKFMAPFTDYWCTPDSYTGTINGPHYRHPGFQELAYLHPNRFTSDRDLLRKCGVDPDQPYCVLRFVSMEAHHDWGQHGIPDETKRKLVDELSEFGTVYVSTEEPIPAEFAKFQQPMQPSAIHHLLAEAELMVTDSGTMATESALLGTPTIRLNSFAEDGVLGVFNELEDYELVYSTANESKAVDRAIELFTTPDSKTEWMERRGAVLDESIDVTTYMLEVIERAVAERL